MKIVLLLVGLVAGVGASLAVPAPTRGRVGAWSPASAGLEAAQGDVTWMCPMHPDHTAETEGQCPRCGMALVRGAPFDVRDYGLSDFVPGGGAAQLIARPLVTAGYQGDLAGDGARLVADTRMTKTVDDLTATLSLDPPTFVAGLYGHLTYRIGSPRRAAAVRCRTCNRTSVPSATRS
jgi:hypothetical protein